MASIQEVLLGLGGWSLELKTWDPELLALLAEDAIVRFYEGQRAFYAGLVLVQNPAEQAPGISGVALDWILGGPDGIGPVITYRDYVAGNNKLGNPELEDDVHWRLSQDSNWSIVGGSASVGADGISDDVLESDETFEARPGEQYRAAVDAHRTGPGVIGRERTRLIFDGRFDHPNLFPDPTLVGGHFTNLSEFPGDADVSGGEIRLGPTTRKQVLHNTGFESFDYWIPDNVAYLAAGFSLSADYAFVGTKSARTPDPADPGGDPDPYFLVEMASDNDLSPGVSGIAVLAHEKYRTTVWFLAPGGTDVADTYMVSTQIQVRSFPSNTDTWFEKVPMRSDELIGNGWRPVISEFEVPEREDGDDHLAMALYIDALMAHTTGHTYVGQAEVTRLVGNNCVIDFDEFDVVPERSYQADFLVTSDAGCVDGSISVITRFFSAARDEIRADVLTMTLTGGLQQRLRFTVEPPSGYDRCVIEFVGHDILGGSFHITGPGRVVDSDPATLVFDGVSPVTSAGVTVEAIAMAPTGTEHVHAVVVAESKSSGWHFTNPVLERYGTPAATVAQVARGLLKSPRTGLNMLSEGAIAGANPILYDRRIRNQHNRDVLRSLCQGGWSEPRIEWRVRPDLTVDVGPAESLYEVHDEFVLVDDDLVLITSPTVARSAETWVSKIRVIGAERKTASGGSVPLVAEADVANTRALVDPLGNPLERVQLVQESSIEHPAFAAAYAAYLAERAAARNEAISVALSDWRATGNFDVGDWLLCYKHDAGVEDLTNERRYRGRTIYPKKLRVVSRTWKLGDGDFRVEVLRPGRAPLDFTDNVKWEATTTADVQFGSLQPVFSVDPEGGSPAKQFALFRGLPR